MADVTIIVLTYERQLWISRFMLSLEKLNFDGTLLICDASSDIVASNIRSFSRAISKYKIITFLTILVS